MSLSSAEQLPNAQGLRRAPSLGIAAPVSVRRVAIEHFGNMPDTSCREQDFHAAEVGAGCFNCRWLEIPDARDGLAQAREGPGPRCAVVIRRLALSILVPLVTAPVRLVRVVQ